MSTETPRLPPLTQDEYDQSQKSALEDFKKLREVELSGPWHVFIRSPEVFRHTQRLGAYLRYNSILNSRLRELVILLVARHWTQDFEFGEHRRFAISAGLADETIRSIADGIRPENLQEDELMVWDFVSELLITKRVSDRSYTRILKQYGERGVVELGSLVGYYSHLAGVMNIARVAPPDGEKRMIRFPE